MDAIQSVKIRSATPDDLEGIVALLKRSSLPPDGLSEHLTTAVVACKDRGIIGSAALEMYGAEALLRSVAVDGACRGQGLGHRLTRAALDMAREHGVATIYLLTETAGEFFPRFGFRPITPHGILSGKNPVTEKSHKQMRQSQQGTYPSPCSRPAWSNRPRRRRSRGLSSVRA